jgi:DNA repair exonuclease SbcCD ATPase subunit
MGCTLLMLCLVSFVVVFVLSQVEEQKQMLAEDDETLEQLRSANLALEQGDKASAEEIQAKLKEFKESRVLTRENATLRYKIEEITQQAKQARDEAAEARAAAEAAETKLKEGGGAGNNAASGSTSVGAGVTGGVSSEETAALQARVEQLEAERQLFREDIKKRHVERTKLVAKLAKLTADNPALLDDEQAGSEGAAAGATAAKEAGGAGSAEQAAEITRLTTRVKQLESALAKAQKMVDEANAAAAAATAAAANANANAAAAAAASAAAGSANASNASTAEAMAAAAASSAAALAAAESAAAQAASAAAARESELTLAVQKLDELLKRREGEMEEIKEKAKEKLTTASNAIKKLKTEYGTLRAAYQKIKDEGVVTPAALQARQEQSARLARRQEILRDIKRNLSGFKANLSTAKENLFVMNADIPALGPSISAAVGRFIAGRAGESQHLRDALKKEMAERRRLFNQIQELKGNIRVYCRVRPMNSREREDAQSQQVITHPAEGELQILNPEKKSTHTFEFEKIFDQTKDQADIFAEVQDLVVSTLDGCT